MPVHLWAGVLAGVAAAVANIEVDIALGGKVAPQAATAKGIPDHLLVQAAGEGVVGRDQAVGQVGHRLVVPDGHQHLQIGVHQGIGAPRRTWSLDDEPPRLR